VAIDTLLARMENDRGSAGGDRRRYARRPGFGSSTPTKVCGRGSPSIDFPSYQPAELIEIANFMAGKRDSAFEQAALDDLESLFAHLANSAKPDAAGLNVAA